MGSKRYLSPREILGDRRRDRHLTAAEILSDELEDDPEDGAAGSGEPAADRTRAHPERAGRPPERNESALERRETPGTDWQWLDDRSVEARDD